MSKEIKQYTIEPDRHVYLETGGIRNEAFRFRAVESPDGVWVRYDDHCAKMEQATKAIAWFADPNNCRHAEPATTSHVDESEFDAEDVQHQTDMEILSMAELSLNERSLYKLAHLRGARYMFNRMKRRTP